MLSLISFILVAIGSLNWFSIGLLQYDFVAGIFGSQANVFSRLVYALVGIASIVMIVNLIKNKGKFVVSLKKANKEFDEYKKENHNKKLAMARAESAEVEIHTHERSNSSRENHKKDD